MKPCLCLKTVLPLRSVGQGFNTLIYWGPQSDQSICCWHGCSLDPWLQFLNSKDSGQTGQMFLGGTYAILCCYVTVVVAHLSL